MKREIIRHRRLDLINSLPRGGQKKIARLCSTSGSVVSAMLNGYRNQNSDSGRMIMRLAEQMAEREAGRQARKQASEWYRNKKNN
ncbi:MAG: hypothetical protein A2W90_14555 [Bacteroidetes bacterium GWF2_42_66]|nr:MAG: hypothetical protein A2W92_15950 [Bacteroidetes bacterium GWA2_42_15]OFX99084.1 MAG: hypothetical protein A2W89_06705 [Bacteroidetes bacterium GWE2_42_39]OFY46747.1 MAG: hypothetical protein A2W90_14555 [Bacteroidetes bacterium GWF2_42_66]HAZ00694.1 hypothetical protein [Marinilabiliales bacterium]HBL73846.1 hypothetical protein [Prolixibacteraceae bacterium]